MGQNEGVSTSKEYKSRSRKTIVVALEGHSTYFMKTYFYQARSQKKILNFLNESILKFLKILNFNFRENFQFKILNPSRKVICKNLVLLVQASDNKFLSTFAKDKDFLNNLAKTFKPQVGRPSTDSYKGVQKEVRN